MKGDFIAGLEALPENWQRKAEKVPVKKETKAGVYDFTCPRSEAPTLVVVTEDNEVFKVTNRNIVDSVFRHL